MYRHQVSVYIKHGSPFCKFQGLSILPSILLNKTNFKCAKLQNFPMCISTLSTRKKLAFSPSHDLHVELIPSLCLGMHCCDHPSAKWSKSNPKLECATSFLMPIPLIRRLHYWVTIFKLNFLKFLITQGAQMIHFLLSIYYYSNQWNRSNPQELSYGEQHGEPIHSEKYCGN